MTWVEPKPVPIPRYYVTPLFKGLEYFERIESNVVKGCLVKKCCYSVRELSVTLKSLTSFCDL